MKKILILILIFYILTLLQTSFLVHFNILGIVPNFVLIGVLFLNFLENSQKKDGIFAAFAGGFFLDVFSENFIGFYILILVGLAIFIKIILKKYIQPVIRPGEFLWTNILKTKKYEQDLKRI